MRKRLATVLMAVGALGGSLVVLAGGPAAATTISVSNETEYRTALTTLSSDASGPHTVNVTADITLSVGTDPTYTGTEPLTLAGNGHTIDAAATSRVLFHDSAAGLAVQDLTVTGGSVLVGAGGGILADSAVTVTNSTFSQNFAFNEAGGGLFADGAVTLTDSTIIQNEAEFGGGVAADGAVTVTSSTVSGNTGAAAGGGIIAIGAATLTDSTVNGNTTQGSGGGINASEAATITNSTVNDNTAFAGGGIAGETVTLTNSTVSDNTAFVESAPDPTGSDGGGILAFSAATITNSTVSGNTADSTGGGIRAGGTVTLTNSTISDNTAEASDGGGILTEGVLTLVFATVVENTASSGANVHSTTTLTSFGSVVALPLGGGGNCVLVGATTSHGFNFSDDASCGFTNVAQGDRENAGSPLLGALADNGGPTQTRLPQTDSPLLDAVPPASCQADGAAGITTDQRGVSRPQGAGCDIGAVEVEAAPAPPTTSPPPSSAAPTSPAALVGVVPSFTG